MISMCGNKAIHYLPERWRGRSTTLIMQPNTIKQFILTFIWTERSNWKNMAACIVELRVSERFLATQLLQKNVYK